MVVASTKMKEYFDAMKKEVSRLHSVATKARQQGYDPAKNVEISLAENMAERVVGLISVIAPRIADTGVVKRIIELEQKYGTLDWRVALTIAREIAEEKFCKFTDKKEAMEVGIRTGFAYVTVGIVSSPLDGIVNIEIKQRMDKKGEYVCVNYAGPIRNAGGTAAAVSVLITDYVRQALGYETYDAQPNEIKRAVAELQDYHERVTNLQYYPSQEEIEFLLPNLPVEVGGDPSEKIEVSNYKDLPRVPTNKIRSGYCLVLSSCIPLKAPKLWKQLSKWGDDVGMVNWQFLEEFLSVQKKAKAGKMKAESDAKISPDYTYIKDIVAGRPVLGHPLKEGGLRLRYGRSRTSGYSAQSMHPATMYLLNQYIAVGTQLKTERPGKAASMTSCDRIDGPIVKLNDGSVIQIKTFDEAKDISSQVNEILFLGDTLVSYGDFFNRAHPLVPAGYCPEWWAQEITKQKSLEEISKQTGIPASRIKQFLNNPLQQTPTVQDAIQLSDIAPLHPAYTYCWNRLSPDEFLTLLSWLDEAKIHTGEKGIEKIVVPKGRGKRALELVGMPHTLVNNEFVVLQSNEANILTKLLSLIDKKASQHTIDSSKTVLENLNKISPVKQRDKGGTFIGARMGRPEKAKQRLLTGNPHVIFPVGDEGGRLRSFQSAMDAGKVTAEFPYYYCEKCKSESVFSKCETCDNETTKKWHCKICGLQDEENCAEHGENQSSEKRAIPIKNYFDKVLKKLKTRSYPQLIKGVRGTSNREHIPEHLLKGILRAAYDIHVYKDGTTRYDMTQLPITHFTPEEINVSVERLKQLGYATDTHGKELTDSKQVIELKPQDVILPNCSESPDEGAAKVLANVAQFVDEELVKIYGQEPIYNIKNQTDLVGQLVIALAPHTSAGMVGRVIGFSKTQGLYAHPLLHAATRRDCDGDEACVILLMDAFLNFSKKYLPQSRGGTMDTPLVLTSILTPSEVDDMIFDLDIPWKYPLELYESALEYKMPWEVQVDQVGKHLNTERQYEGTGYTHGLSSINKTVRCSFYKTLPSMEEKLKGQMDIAEKVSSVETEDVARLVIEKHFLKDIKGNLRKFSMQQFRCVKCNTKYRRPPLFGACTKCKGRIIFTIAQGSVIKYLEPTVSLANAYNVSPYLKQTIELLQRRVDEVFGREKEKQTGLGAWFD